jgi:hypothetical protein
VRGLRIAALVYFYRTWPTEELHFERQHCLERKLEVGDRFGFTTIEKRQAAAVLSLYAERIDACDLELQRRGAL